MKKNTVEKLVLSSILLIFTGLLLNTKSIPAAASEIYFINHTTNSELLYSGAEVCYCYNGTPVSLGCSIGILGESGSAMAPMSELMKDALNVTCEFNLSDQAITFRYGSNTVKVTPGSKQAYVNGKKTEMSEAPVILEDQNNISKIYIPTKLIISNLGYEYDWNKSLSTVFITKTSTISYTSSIDSKPIEIPLDESVTISDIRTEDLYYNKEFVVYIKGDYADDYQNNTIINRYSEIKNIELGNNQSGETVLKFSTSRILACKTEVRDHVLYLTFDRPKNIYNKIVVIDPGHGGYDSGAIRDDLYESNFNLAIAFAATKNLFEASDIKVYYTRVNDTYPSLDSRAAFAAKVDADFFVSLHQNTNSDTNVHGTQIYYSVDNNATLASGISSKTMAKLFRDNITSILGTVNCGVFGERPLTVTTLNSVPSVLVELLFMSNPDELTRLQNAEFQKEAGQVLFDTIKQLFELYPTGR